MTTHVPEVLAGLGLFLVGLSTLSDAVRTLAARRLRAAMSRLQRVPLANAVTGSLLGMLTQSSNAATHVCIGLLKGRAMRFDAALSVSAWSGVGTTLLVFLASIDLRVAALFAISMVALLYLSSLHRKGVGRSATDLLIALGIMLLGLAMIKDYGHVLESDPWAREFFQQSAASWVYGFFIGVGVTLVMQSSSTVSILAVALSAANLLQLADAMVLVCGANLGSGLSVALSASHLKGQARQLAVWQAVVKGLGTLAVLLPTLLLAASGGFASDTARSLPVPTSIAVTFLALNVAGAVLAGVLQKPLAALLERWVSGDDATKIFELQHIVDARAEDPETALLLARQEQARLIGLLPAILAPLRPDEEQQGLRIDNAERRRLGAELAGRIAEFVSEAVHRHPDHPDRGGMLLVQRCNNQVVALLHALHELVDELGSPGEMSAREVTTRSAMTESVHLLLTLLADQAAGQAELGDLLREMTADRSDTMTRFRSELVAQGAGSGRTQESMFIATTLFERIVWLIAQVSGDVRELGQRV
ncbi:MAG: Na/Pi cotransporter family protein [Rhodocyclaceae bacterium]|nr:Na/Pi cotransporter family protein [Rhodocyclaceae bacterium]